MFKLRTYSDGSPASAEDARHYRMLSIAMVVIVCAIVGAVAALVVEALA